MNNNQPGVLRTLKHIKAILGVFLAILVLYLLKVLADLFAPLVFALFFAILLQPMVTLFRKWFSLNISVILTTIISVIAFLAISFGFYSVVDNFIENRDELLGNITEKLQPLSDELTFVTGRRLEEGELKEYISGLIPSDEFLSISGSFISTVSGFTTELLMTILYFAALLSAIAEYERVINYIVNKREYREHTKAATIFANVKNCISIYIKVKTVVSVMTGLGIGLVSWAFGIKYALLWGLLAFILNYIPYLGSLIAIIPPLLLGLLHAGSISEVVFLYLALQAVQLVMGSMVEPKITGNSLSINTVTVLFSLVFWGYMWNVAGMLLAVPLTYLIKEVLQHVQGAGFMVRLMEQKSGRVIKE